MASRSNTFNPLRIPPTEVKSQLGPTTGPKPVNVAAQSRRAPETTVNKVDGTNPRSFDRSAIYEGLI